MVKKVRWKNTQFKIEDDFGGILAKYSILSQQTTILNDFKSRMMWFLLLV